MFLHLHLAFWKIWAESVSNLMAAYMVLAVYEGLEMLEGFEGLAELEDLEFLV